MGTKEKLLHLLEENRGHLVSGETAAQTLGISRAAVWKAAQALRNQGHEVEAVQGSGYRLSTHSDVLSQGAVQAAFGKGAPPVRVFDKTDSTNIQAKLWAVEDAPHGALVMAEKQTAGRGRLGRSFESPPGGLYMSVVLRPKAGVGPAGLVTSAAAVAACRAVWQLCGLQLQIKWVNDLYLDGKKCCGILTEAGTGLEGGELEYLVVGIGINYTTPTSAFEGTGKGVATSLFPKGDPPLPRAHLAAAIHHRLLGLFNALPNHDFLQEYRDRSLVLGKPVTVLAQKPYPAVAVEIDDEARLVVQTPQGTRQTLSYGEISVQL